MRTERELRMLVDWVHKWDTINKSIIRFTKNSHALHPFSVPFASGNGGGGNKRGVLPSTHTAASTEAGEAEPEEEKEKEGLAFDEVEEIDNVSVMYARVYDMLSTYGKIEYWSNAVLLQHLLASSLRAWVHHLCVCSGGRLGACPQKATQELSPPELSWTSDAVESCWEEVLVMNSESWTQSTTLTMDVVQKRCHRGLSGASAMSAAATPAEVMTKGAMRGEECNANTTERAPDPGQRETRGGVSTIISDDGRERYKDEEEEEEDILSLHSIVNFALHYHRMRWFLKVVFLRVDVEMNDIVWRILRSCIRSTLEHNSSMIQMILCRTAERSVKCAIAGDTRLTESSLQSPSSPYSSPSAMQTLRGIRDGDIPLVSRVMSMLDDCGADKITIAVTESVVRICQEEGIKLGRTVLGPLTTPGASSIHECAPTLQDALAALDKCMGTFTRLRASIVLFFGGSVYDADEVWEVMRERTVASLHAFSAGLCQGEVLLDFVSAWALPLCIRACEEEREKTVLPLTTATVAGRHCSSSTGCPLDEMSIFGNTYKRRTSSSCLVPPRPGFAMLIYFLSPEPKFIAKFEACFAAALMQDLEKRIAVVQKTDVPLQGIPREVYQHCVFFLKMTNQLLLPIAASGCEGANTTLRGVRKSLHSFFVAREPSVILTLVGALHAQVTEGQPRDSNTNNNTNSGTNLEIVDTILELASLLHSKDLFVDCYSGLLAGRLIKMQHAMELDVDTEVISRLGVRLGELLAAEPLALLRDIRTSMVDPRCVITPLSEAQKKQGLLRHVRVLCAARWDKYVPVTMKLSDMWKCFESNQWFDEEMLHAMESFEEHYDSFGCVDVCGVNSGHESSSRGGRLRSLFGGGETPSNVVDEDGDNDDNNSRGSSGNIRDDNADASDNSISFSLPNSISPDAIGRVVQQQRRQLAWSLGNGALTIVCRGVSLPQQELVEGGGRDVPSSVQLVMPPIGLLVLQALERYGDASSTPSDAPRCTFDFLHSCLPVVVPKMLLGAVLSSLVRHRVVQRTVHKCGKSSDAATERGINTYSLPLSFSGCRRRKVVIDVSDAAHHWVPRTQEDYTDSKAAAISVNGIVEVERMKKLEAGIVRVMKTRRCLSHTDLFTAVADQLSTHFVVTAPMLKRCLAQLIEREFIARDGKDMYVYLF